MKHAKKTKILSKRIQVCNTTACSAEYVGAIGGGGGQSYPCAYLNKFEIARVLGLRTMQIAQEGCGMPTVHSRAEGVAIDDLLHGRIPYTIHRAYP